MAIELPDATRGNLAPKHSKRYRWFSASIGSVSIHSSIPSCQAAAVAAVITINPNRRVKIENKKVQTE